MVNRWARDFQELGLESTNKVGHLLSDSNSKLVIEISDRILLSKLISKVSEI